MLSFLQPTSVFGRSGSTCSTTGMRLNAVTNDFRWGIAHPSKFQPIHHETYNWLTSFYLSLVSFPDTLQDSESEGLGTRLCNHIWVTHIFVPRPSPPSRPSFAISFGSQASPVSFYLPFAKHGSRRRVLLVEGKKGGGLTMRLLCHSFVISLTVSNNGERTPGRFITRMTSIST